MHGTDFANADSADKDSCEALQTSDIDDPFDVEHASPYTYVADKAFISAARSLNKTATESCPPEHPACGLQTTLREASGKTCEQCYTRFRYTADIQGWVEAFLLEVSWLQPIWGTSQRTD